MEQTTIGKTVRLLLLFFLVAVIAFYGKPFLVPLVFGMLLSMLLLPLSERLSRLGLNRGVSIIFSILIFVMAILVLVGLLAWQISDLTEEAPQIEQKLSAGIKSAKQKLTDTFGLPPDMLSGKGGGDQMAGAFTSVAFSVGGFLVDFILVLVYMFLFLFYKNDLKAFMLKIVPQKEKQNAREIIESSRQVAQKYLTGMALMIMILWVLYGIGFSIVGIDNPIFFAMLCGTLEIIPFVGNLIGSLVTAAFALVQGDGPSMAVGVLITYGIVQFFQTYILEPLVVGRGVNINPLFTITGLVAGEFIWGIPGIVLAIPVLGITKIVFDHIEGLKPYGELIGNKPEEADYAKKLKDWFKRKKKR